MTPTAARRPGLRRPGLRRPSLRRPSLRRYVLAVASLVLVIGGCSVSTNDEPVAVDDVFEGLVQSTTTSSSTSTPTEVTKEVTVYFLRTTEGGSTELVPVSREVDVDVGIEGVLDNLFNNPPGGEEGPASERGLGTSISDTATLLSAELVPEEQRLVVDVNGLFGGSQGSGLRDALAQIVWTATEDPTVARVSFRNNGSPVSAIVGNGDLVDRPVDRSDYRTLS